MSLPDDYSRCQPRGCVLRSHCARWVENAPPLPVAAFPQWVSFADFSVHLSVDEHGPTCKFFMSRE